MCVAECMGDFYRGCGCYKRLWWTGKVTDCNKPDCAKSRAHAHRTTTMCYCTLEYQEHRRVQNYFQFKCDDCEEEEETRRGRGDEFVGRNIRFYGKT